jgi:hypothetical protein
LRRCQRDRCHNQHRHTTGDDQSSISQHRLDIARLLFGSKFPPIPALAPETQVRQIAVDTLASQ